MANTITSPVFRSLGSKDKDVSAKQADSTNYWWNTTGRDLANMIHEAAYPEEAQRQFLTFYQDAICPQLDSRPDATSPKSTAGKHGDCIEYSFEFKERTKNPGVRFGVDLSHLRPINQATPLSITASENVIKAFRTKISEFDDTWYRALRQYFDCSHFDAEKQNVLIEKAGHRMPLGIGFDIYPQAPVPGTLPLMAKVYFSPCFVAADKGITRWDVVRTAIRQLPDIDSFPNILSSLKTLESYLATKPQEWQDGVRYLATDFVAPQKTRLKLYIRCPSQSFEDIWDFYTLGGLIEGLEEDKEKFRDLMSLISGGSIDADIQGPDMQSLTKARAKTTAIYFSLSAHNPGPGTKIGFFPLNTAENDEVIAKGLDTWLSKYGWYDGGKTLEERLNNVFTHRTLKDNTGIFSFVNIGRKEHPTKKDLSIQAYVTPELYSDPRC